MGTITKHFKYTIISWDQNSEGWAAFQYEHLPNICYCCSCVSHDNKDYVLWLSSKGMLTVDEQQFGLWISATQFNPARKEIVEVQGYDLGHPKSSIGILRRATSGQIIKSESHVEVDNLICEELRMNFTVSMEGLAMEDNGSVEIQ